jgi:RNA polymerase sigma-70 factor (ECF subfamily)
MLLQDLPKLEVQPVSHMAHRESEAFGSLYDSFSKRLYCLAVYILNDHLEAQDVLEEVFIFIWKQAPTFNDTTEKLFRSAITMTQDKALDRIRARSLK